MSARDVRSIMATLGALMLFGLACITQAHAIVGPAGLVAIGGAYAALAIRGNI